MQKTPSYNKLMEGAIRASKEIIALKKAYQAFEYWRQELKRRSYTDLTSLEHTQHDIKYRIAELERHVSAIVTIIAGDTPFFPEITHFTQKEMDAGYHITEVKIVQDVFDEEGDFTGLFVSYALILHNGIIIPFTQANSHLILSQAKPV